MAEEEEADANGNWAGNEAKGAENVDGDAINFGNGDGEHRSWAGADAGQQKGRGLKLERRHPLDKWRGKK